MTSVERQIDQTVLATKKQHARKIESLAQGWRSMVFDNENDNHLFLFKFLETQGPDNNGVFHCEVVKIEVMRHVKTACETAHAWWGTAVEQGGLVIQ